MTQRNGCAVVGGFPTFVPNSTIDGDGFYISYNDHDASLYGTDTTALVLGQMSRFYILNGDHRNAFVSLIGKGFDACFAYFCNQSDLMNKFSDPVVLDAAA